MRTAASRQLRVALGLTFAALLAACSGGGASNDPPPPAPAIQLSAASLSFSGTLGGANPAAQTFTVSNSGGGALAAPTTSIAYGSGSNWLTATVSGAGAPYTVTVEPSMTGVAAGTFSATLSISSAGASNSPRTVAVTLTVVDPRPAIDLSSTTISFSGVAGSASPAPQTITISNGGNGTLAAPDGVITFPNATDWLDGVISGASSPYALTLTPNAAGLPAGTYTADVTITSAGASNSPRTVSVSMTLVDPPPLLATSVGSVAFTSRSYPDADPAARSLTISNEGGGTLAPPDAVLEFPNATDWLDGVVTGAATPYTITLQPTVAALALGAGTYTATLRVSSPGAANTLSIPVTLTLTTSWTVFVYGHGDHTLSESLLADIQEMNQAILGESINVAVAADYSAGRTMPNGTPFPVGTVAYEIAGSGNPPAEIATGIEENFDDPAVLTAWTQSAFESYPADRYAIVLWDHGGSWEGGFGGDEQNVPDQQGAPMLPDVVADAVSTALGNVGLTGLRPLEFLAFDTCLMMGNEVAYEFRDLADVYLAAAEIDFGNGWDYTASLSELGADPDIAAVAFGLAEVAHWDAHHATAGLEDALIRAHAAIDLSQMSAYASSWQSLASAIAQSAAGDWLELARTQFDALPGYGMSTVIDVDPQPHLRDAGQLLGDLALSATDPDVAAAATSAAAALDALVINASLGLAREAAGQSGMQVEAPLGTSWLGKAAQYTTLDWDIATGWGDVLDGFAANADATPPVIATTVTNAGAATPIDPAVVTLSSDDADVAFARMYLAETIGGKVMEYGVVGQGAVDPATAYEFSWGAEQPALADATDLSEIYIAPWLTAGATTLFLLPGRIGGADVFAIYEDGSTTVDGVLVVSSGNAAAFSLEDFGGLSFVPLVLNSTDGVWVEATPLAIPNVPGATLDFGWAPVAGGTYHLATTMTDVWGNVDGVVDDVTVN